MSSVMAAFVQSVSLENYFAQVQKGNFEEVESAFYALEDASITPEQRYIRTMSEKIGNLKDAIWARKENVDEQIAQLEQNAADLTAENASVK